MLGRTSPITDELRLMRAEGDAVSRVDILVARLGVEGISVWSRLVREPTMVMLLLMISLCVTFFQAQFNRVMTRL